MVKYISLLVACLLFAQAMATSSDASDPSSDGGPSASSDDGAPVVPTGVAFNLPSPIRMTDKFNINVGSVPAGQAATVRVLLILTNGDEIALFGPAPFPSGPQEVIMPTLVDQQNGVFIRITTIGENGIVLDTGCSACDSPTFDLLKGGLAADTAAVAAAEAGPPTAGVDQAPPEEVTFFFRVSQGQGEKLNAADRATAINSVNAAGITPAAAFNVLASLGEVLDKDAGVPSAAEATKIEALCKAALSSTDTSVIHVLSSIESTSLIVTLKLFIASFGLRPDSKKFNAQLNAQEEAANVIQKVLEQLRQVGAQTEAVVGAIDFSNLCSEVVAVNTGGTFCNGPNFPHVVVLAGAALPIATHRVTAVAMNLAEMARSDETLTTTLDLTTAVSPHYSDITTPLVTEPTAHTLTSTFDTAKGADFAAAADTTFNCFQRIATANADPSGSYNQLAAAQQARPSGTTITCQGANSNQIRWVTLAKAITTPPVSPTVAQNPSTLSAPDTTTTGAVARSVAASSDDDDGSSASGIVGGAVGGGCCLLLLLAALGFLLLKAKKNKKAKPAAGGLAADDIYWQSNGAYKAPAPTPIATAPIIVAEPAPIFV